MEMYRYVTVCRRWWWLVLAAFVATVVATIALLGTPARVYESTASFVIQPQALEEGDQVRALDALVQGGTVGETYASIARSKLVRARAVEALTSEERAQHMTVSAEVVTGTRIIRLTVIRRTAMGRPPSLRRLPSRTGPVNWFPCAGRRPGSRRIWKRAWRCRSRPPSARSRSR